MKRLGIIGIFGIVLIFMLGFPSPALTEQYIEVLPLDHDFGDVQVGTASTAMITISNIDGHELYIDSVTLSGSADFAITMYPDNPVGSGSWTAVEVTFTPSATGYVAAVLEIMSNDMEFPLVSVSLAGMGVGQEQPPVSVSDILDFFDTSVADVTLYGDGPGNSADGRMNALRNMIEAAGDLIDDGYLEEGWQQLLDAYERCDGLPRPPEFVAGPGAATLAQMILELMAELGCNI